MTQHDPFFLFAETLREARQAKRFTQREVATRIGVSVQTLSNWETGSSSPKFENALKWAAVLGYEVRLTSRTPT